jgi:polyhydroxyalkanoate synthase
MLLKTGLDIGDRNMEGEDFLKNMQEFNSKYLQAVNILMQKKMENHTNPFMDFGVVQKAFLDAVGDFATHPAKFFEHNLEYAARVSNLMFHFMDRMNGTKNEPLYEVSVRDRRFKDKAWQESLYFNFVKQFYLMSSDWYRSMVKKLDVPSSQKKLVEFYTEQLLNAASPTNFVNLNPEVLNELVNSNGKNLIQGIENFLEDIQKSDNLLNISTASSEFFSLGKNIASSKGKVIYQNELMQLICYEPAQKTYSIPLLIIPPWINKYYILDLSHENSFIKFLQEKGFQVYLVSWVNPSSNLADKNFEDYLKQGIEDSIDFLKKTFNYDQFNVLGYCLGGTLAACAAAYFADKKQNYIKSLTFLTTMLDFSEPGDLGLFVNNQTIEAIKEELAKKGYFSGRYMSYAFSLLRANELIWSFVVNNYLLGKKPMAFDLLYWNADSTNLPASMHTFYLENMYINNKLVSEEGINLLGHKIDLKKIQIPTFFLSTIEDHIAPWESTYQGAKYIAQNSKIEPVFCLAGSGHIAGVINPPKAKKYSYYTNSDMKNDASSWMKEAKEFSGSWWEYWINWICRESEDMKNSIDYNKLEYIEEAPGSYVKVKII